MIPEFKALWAAVVAAPADASPKLVLADWLDERDEDPDLSRGLRWAVCNDMVLDETEVTWERVPVIPKTVTLRFRTTVRTPFVPPDLSDRALGVLRAVGSSLRPGRWR